MADMNLVVQRGTGDSATFSGATAHNVDDNMSAETEADYRAIGAAIPNMTEDPAVTHVYVDANGNGQRDDGEREIDLAAMSTALRTANAGAGGTVTVDGAVEGPTPPPADPAPADEATPSPDADQPLDVNFGLGLEALGIIGSGDVPHSGGAGSLFGRLTLRDPDVPWIGGDLRLGLGGGHMGADFGLPNGETATSGVGMVGGNLYLGANIMPFSALRGLDFALGLQLGIYGLLGQDGATETLPTDCVPGELGLGECEPQANAGSVPTGTGGVYNSTLGNSTGADGGTVLTVGPRIGAGYSFPMGDSLGGRVGAFYQPTWMNVNPGDAGHGGFSQWGHNLGLNFTMQFGRSSVTHPRPTTPVDNGPDGPVSPANSPINVAQGDDATVNAPSGGWPEWPAGSRVLVRHADGSTATPDVALPTGTGTLTLPATSLEPGRNTVEIGVPGATPLVTGEVVVPTAAPAVDADGDVTVGNFRYRGSVPAQAVAGQGADLGRITPRVAVPAGVSVTIRVNEEVAATITAPEGGFPANVAIPLVLTQAQLDAISPQPSDNAVQIQIGSVVFTNTLNIRPPVATLTSATRTSSATRYSSDTFTLSVNSDQATRARVTVGTHHQDFDLTTGANSLSLTGRPRDWNHGGARGRYTAIPVTIQPLDAEGNPTGTAITVSPDSQFRRSGGGGGGRSTGTITVPGL